MSFKFLNISYVLLELFHDGGRYHIETSPFALQMDWVLYDNGLHHKRVKGV